MLNPERGQTDGDSIRIRAQRYDHLELEHPRISYSQGQGIAPSCPTSLRMDILSEHFLHAFQPPPVLPLSHSPCGDLLSDRTRSWGVRWLIDSCHPSIAPLDHSRSPQREPGQLAAVLVRAPEDESDPIFTLVIDDALRNREASLWPNVLGYRASVINFEWMGKRSSEL